MHQKTPTLLACVIASGLLLGCSQSATTSCSLTEWETANTPAMGVTINSTANDYLGQTFYLPTTSTPPGTVSVASIQLQLNKVGTGFSTHAGANTVTVSLEKDVSGGIITASESPPPAPLGGSAVATSTVDLFGVSTGVSQVTFKFASAVSLTQSVSYWILVTAAYQGPVAGNQNYVQWMDYNGGSIYSYGSAYIHTSGEVLTSFWNAQGTQTYFEFSVNSC